MASRRYVTPLVLLLALAGGLAWMWWMLDGLATTKAAAPRDATRPIVDGAPAESVASGEDPRRVADAPAPVDAPAPAGSLDELPILPATRLRADFTASIEDATGQPVADVDVRIDSWIGGHAAELPIGDDRDVHVRMRSDVEGRVRVAQLAEGPYRLEARAADGGFARARFAFRGTDAAVLRVVLSATARGRSGVELEIVGGDGAPIAGAEVELHGGEERLGVVGVRGRAPLSAKSDARGRATFAEVSWSQGLAFARAADGRTASSELDSNDHDIESDYEVSARLVVEAGGSVAGRIDGGSDDSLRGATVDAFHATSQVPWYWTFGRTFRAPIVARSFRFDGLPKGVCSFVLNAPGGARLVLDRYSFGEKLDNSVTAPIVEVKAGETSSIRLTATDGASIRGRVRKADGTPIVNAAVVAVFAPSTSNFPDGFVLHGVNVWRFDGDNEQASDHPLTHVQTRSDAKGEYALVGLQPGRQRVLVTSPGRCFDRREGVVVADGQTTTLEHVLDEAGALQGLAPDSGYFGITRAGEAAPTAIAILGNERSFTFAGLRPGTYLLSQFHSNAEVAPIERARAEVLAGRTTYVDLTDAEGPCEITGQVVDGNGPVLDAEVELFPTRRRVDGAGRFKFHRGFRLGDTFSVRVIARRITTEFECDARPFDGKRWEGVLRLGDERLQIECTDSRGAPVAGEVVLMREAPSESEDQVQVRSAPLRLDDLGSVVAERLLSGLYRVHLQSRSGLDVSSIVVLPRPDVLRLEVPDGGTLEVTLLDAGGRPVRDWIIQVAAYLRDGEIPADIEGHGEWFQWTEARTDARGVGRLKGLRAGWLIVQAVGPDHGNPEQQPEPLRLELARDQTRRIEMRLTTGH